MYTFVRARLCPQQSHRIVSSATCGSASPAKWEITFPFAAFSCMESNRQSPRLILGVLIVTSFVSWLAPVRSSCTIRGRASYAYRSSMPAFARRRFSLSSFACKATNRDVGIRYTIGSFIAAEVHGRRLIIERARAGWKQAHIAAAMGISRTCVKRWIMRYRAEGEDGLVDRSSRPHTSPTRTSAEDFCAHKRHTNVALVAGDRLASFTTSTVSRAQ